MTGPAQVDKDADLELSERVARILADRFEDFLQEFGFGIPTTGPLWQTSRKGSVSVRPGRSAALEASYVASSVVEPGYFTVMERDGVVWMTTNLLERESHAWHLSQAKGRVVVAGLGLGLIVHAMATKEEVDRILVVEIDPDVVSLFLERSDFATWPCRDKVEIFVGDAFSDEFYDHAVARGFRCPDYLYADIWPDYPAVGAPEETADLCRSFQPAAAGWWAQELHLAIECEDKDLTLDLQAAERYFYATRVPASLDEGYVRFCREAAQVHGIAIDAPAPTALRTPTP